MKGEPQRVKQSHKTQHNPNNGSPWSCVRRRIHRQKENASFEMARTLPKHDSLTSKRTLKRSPDVQYVCLLCVSVLCDDTIAMGSVHFWKTNLPNLPTTCKCSVSITVLLSLSLSVSLSLYLASCLWCTKQSVYSLPSHHSLCISSLLLHPTSLEILCRIGTRTSSYTVQYTSIIRTCRTMLLLPLPCTNKIMMMMI